jgi:formamidopyrimidine-DNA glycosylase
VWLTDQPEKILGKLGPEPLEKSFTSQWLFENLHQRKRSLKPLLLDQTFIAGLGNIYTDECLHIAQLHPLVASNNVSQKQAETLHEAIRAVLKEGIRRNGASIDWVYRGGDYQNYFRLMDAADVCVRHQFKIHSWSTRHMSVQIVSFGGNF